MARAHSSLHTVNINVIQVIGYSPIANLSLSVNAASYLWGELNLDTGPLSEHEPIHDIAQFHSSQTLRLSEMRLYLDITP